MTSVDIEEVIVSCEDGLIGGGEDGCYNLVVPIDVIRVGTSLVDRRRNGRIAKWVGNYG